MHWTNTNEFNLAQYDVERRIDGNNFAATGSINTRNTPGIHQYDLQDATPVSGNNFYRIKSIEFDGTFKYFEIAKVHVSYLSNKSVHLYPNPVVAGLNIWLNNLALGFYEFRMEIFRAEALKYIACKKLPLPKPFLFNQAN